MAKVLITGASGLLGQALTRRLSPSHEIIATSKTGRSGTQACELSDEKQVHTLFDKKPDWVINCAAYSDVDGCEKDPGLAHASNGLAVKYLSQACKERHLPLIHVSTDYVFDGKKRTPYEADEATNPVNIYGLSKLEGEFYAKQNAYRTAVVRTSWLFGSGVENNFVNAVLKRLRSEKQVNVLADQIDSPTYAEDLAEALEKIAGFLIQSKAPVFKIFQFCNKGQTTRLEMTEAMRDILKLDVSVSETDRSKIVGRVAVRAPYLAMSTQEYEKQFGEIRPWREALKSYLLK